jgi:hypothetical protein
MDRWQMQFAVLRAHVDDLNVYVFHRLRQSMDEDEQKSRQIVHQTIAALLAAILLVVATYFYS